MRLNKIIQFMEGEEEDWIFNTQKLEQSFSFKSHSQAIQRRSQVDFLECKEETTDGSFLNEPENHT